jgi:hypothetical protein
LPSDRREAVERIVAEHGDPDAWRHRFFEPEESPLEASDFSSRPIPDVIAFLKTWRPENEGLQRQTITALGQELRTAVGNNPNFYAAAADQFVGIKPIYVRHFMEGLHNAAGQLQHAEWGNVLKLIDDTLSRDDKAIDPAAHSEGDDKNWGWARMSAAELLTAGLLHGPKGIPFEYVARVQEIVLKLVRQAPRHEEIADFNVSFRRSPYFTAQRTLRGRAVELCVLFVRWLSFDQVGAIASEPKAALETLSEIRVALDEQLQDRTPDGWVPRAIIGRWLRLLCYFGERWLKQAVPALFPAEDDELRHSAWWSHLGHDNSPLVELMTELSTSYVETIERLSLEESDADVRELLQERLAQYIMLLHLWGKLPDDLLELFCKHAPDSLRRFAMWFVGEEVARPPSQGRKGMKTRGMKYWEWRLSCALRSDRPDDYRRELGSIGHWCFLGQVDETWLGEQLIRALAAGFVPNDASDVISWLQKLAPNKDRAVEIMQPLLRNPRIDRWTYMTQREQIRAVLSDGLSSGRSETIRRSEEIIGFLSSIGETSHLELLPPIVLASEDRTET